MFEFIYLLSEADLSRMRTVNYVLVNDIIFSDTFNVEFPAMAWRVIDCAFIITKLTLA